jgi:hypothetical protein
MRFVLVAFSLSLIFSSAACSQQATAVLAPSPTQASSLLGARHSGTIGLWTANGAGGHLFGLTTNGKVLVTSIYTKPNCNEGPNTVKVDSSQNVWVNCYLIDGSAEGGGMLEYSSSGKLEHTYPTNAQAECPTGDSCFFSSWDGGWDSKGHVFAEANGSDETKHQALTSGFYWWNARNKSGSATFIPTGSGYCDPVCTIWYMDVDAQGNIWFDFAGGQNSDEGAGLGEVKNPTTHPSFAVVFPAGTYEESGGVYINDRTQILNVVDRYDRIIYRYHLPVKAKSKPFQKLGPTGQNLSGKGEPNTGGFNKDDSKTVLGDYFGWLDIGTVRTNSWKLVSNVNFTNGAVGAAYTPSDKTSSP